MRKKIKGMHLPSLTQEYGTIYFVNEKDDFYKRSFSDKQVKILNNDFSKFYKLMSDNCFDDKRKNILKRYKKKIKIEYFLNVNRKYSPMIELPPVGVFSEEQQKELKFNSARREIFFLADIVLAFIIGDDERLKTMKEELEKRQNERRKHDYKLLRNMKEIETTKKPKPSQFECLIEANRVIKKYDESELMDILTGKPTQKAVDTINSYKSQKTDL
jgi:hypothetical protein